MKVIRWAMSVALLSATAGGYYWYRVETRKDPLADVLTAEVVKGDVVAAVQATGELRPVRLVAVGAQVSGRIVSLPVRIGQRLKKGDLVARIDGVPQTNDLKTAQAMLADTKAQKRQKEAALAYAESALQRDEETMAKAATSKDAYESAKATVETTKAQIESLDAQISEAEVKIDVAKVNLAYTEITSPIDGTVLLVEAQEGQTVNAVQSAPTIAVVGQVDQMAVRAEISEADAPGLKPGLKSSFSILGDPSRVWEATLSSLDPAPDSLRSDSDLATSSSQSSSSSASTTAIYYYGRFEVPNPDGLLRTYMTANVSIVLGEAKGVLTVPASSVSGAPSARTVDVVQADGSIAKRPVVLGLTDKLRYEVKSGLAAGEKVVVGRRSTDRAPTMPGPPGGL